MTGNPLAPDQHSKIGTFNIAPTWTHLIGTTAVFTFGGFVRKDQYNYYPSTNPFNDLAPDLQSQTFTQDRKLTNVGVRSDISYVKGIHNLKAGLTNTLSSPKTTGLASSIQPSFRSTYSAMAMRYQGPPSRCRW